MREIEVIPEQDILVDDVFGIANHEFKYVDVLLSLSIIIFIRKHQNLLKGQLAWLGLLHSLRSRPAMQCIMFVLETAIDSLGNFG